jgi:sentrin-specific protease 8
MKSQSLLYHDCQVYDYDLETLRPGEWLNDTIIEFCFEYFEQDIFKQQQRFLFLRPAIVFLMMHTKDRSGLESALPIGLQENDIIFLPINDSDGIDSGTHWSLLIYWKKGNSFYHYDSIGCSNDMMARYCKDRIAELVGSSMTATFVPIDTPQQQNGYDCGVYVIAIAKLIASRLVQRGFDVVDKEANDSIFQITSNSITDQFILETRKKFFTLISQLMFKNKH